MFEIGDLVGRYRTDTNGDFPAAVVMGYEALTRLKSEPLSALMQTNWRAGEHLRAFGAPLYVDRHGDKPRALTKRELADAIERGARPVLWGR